MKPRSLALRELFENAQELSFQIIDGNHKLLDDLNRQIVAKKLGGSLVVLSNVYDEINTNSMVCAKSSHTIPAGRLGKFGIYFDEDMDEPELIIELHDVRGAVMEPYRIILDDQIVPYDAHSENADSYTLHKIKEYLTSRNFTFAGLAELCKYLDGEELELAQIALELNDFRLPYHLASQVTTRQNHAFYYHKGINVLPNTLERLQFYIDIKDMFVIYLPAGSSRATLRISNMNPADLFEDFRDLLVDSEMDSFVVAN